MLGYILQQILNGIQLGSIYALIALGYTLVYGIIKLINFAHADIFMVGAYIALFLTAFYAGGTQTFPFQIWIWTSLIAGYLIFDILKFKLAFLKNFFLRLDRPSRKNSKRTMNAVVRACANGFGIVLFSALVFPFNFFFTKKLFSLPLGFFLFPLTILYVMLVCGILGSAMERIAYRPLRYRGRLSALITALGVSLFLENFCSQNMVFSSKYQAFPEIIKKADLLRIPALDIVITNVFFLNIAVLAVLLAGLWLLVEKTLLGKQMRAVAFDKKTASLMGIDIDRIISAAFIIGPALAGVSGILYGMNYGILQSPFLGFFPGIKAFIAAVLGGIGSLPGAVIGAFIMGISEVFANSIDSNLGFAAAFVILIIILLIKPTGIMGKSDSEKV